MGRILAETRSAVRAGKQTASPASANSGPRVVLAHDWLVGLRGGEQVLDRLARMFGPTHLYTLVHDRTAELTPAIEACTVHTSRLQRWPGGKGRLRRWYLPLYPQAIEALEIPANQYDLLISTSSSLIKSIRPPLGADGRTIPHLCYCHTPPRYLWDQRHDYTSGDLAGKARTLGLASSSRVLRQFDRRTASRITKFIANSTHTARRIKRFYQRDATVIHPPVDIDFYTPDPTVPREEFFLIVSALEPYKRVDLAIKAALQKGFRLKIAGGGSQFSTLQKLAQPAPNIEFLNHQRTAELRTLYRKARALLFPGMEDFGIVPVEAMACGCPVIAFHQGGVEDWLGEDCGITFTEQTVKSLNDTIQQFECRDRTPAGCRVNAARFSNTRFDTEIAALVNLMLNSAEG